MRRPTRTRRLSIAAMVSLLAFILMASAGVRSFWTWDDWNFDNATRQVVLENGRLVYSHDNATAFIVANGHKSGVANRHFTDALWASVGNEQPFDVYTTYFVIRFPLWPLLLLLLIAPVLWLIARPASAPAFPVVTKQP